ncbi:AAA family ATPase [Aliikangiella marina]|uniref:AAA family ATPase n=1 Tax=Aliikangiella marina TaxID=1712262 RepID=A0A545TCD6_9GAMM|nr:ExeA family protein [Aliikangiella marina]TQV74875.1 AAA family ATPase [Aliikangiella marina]
MYLEYFSLKERPFSISPDPRFLFMSNRYREALTHLTYGIQEGGGFVLLTGEVGTGKTTVCRCLLQQLPKDTRLAFVLNPKLNSRELLATICDEFKIEYPENCESLKVLTDKLTTFLLACHQQDLNVVVMIDEAQNIETEVLEQIRLLTNLETNQKKLLQVILVGQPELQEKLAQRDLRQLAQRITARYHLRPLNLKETIAYILHRTRIAGSQRALFSRQAVEHLHAKTQGIPRLINTICDRALMAAANRQKKNVDKKIIAEAVIEVMGTPVSQVSNKIDLTQWIKPVAASVGVLAIAFAAFWMGKQGGDSQQPAGLSISNKTAPKESDSKASSVSQGSVNLVERLIGDQSWDYNGQRSFTHLFNLWQIEYSAISHGEACQYAETYGLKCSRTIGNWQQLREFNRPALLKFSAGLQGEFWGLLRQLKGLEATVQFGDKISQIKLDELSSVWTGEYIALWQAPEGFTGDVKLGDSGEVVAWLSSNLIELSQSSGSVQNTFDAQLQNQLKAFQSRKNIRADGIAGMRTILKINAETLQGIPLLDSIN